MHWCQDETNCLIQNIGMLQIIWAEIANKIIIIWNLIKGKLV